MSNPPDLPPRQCQVLRCQEHIAEILPIQQDHRRIEVGICTAHHVLIDAGGDYAFDEAQSAILMGDDLPAAGELIITGMTVAAGASVLTQNGKTFAE